MGSTNALSVMAIVACTLFSVQASASLNWSKEVPDVCGIKLHRQTGEISFKGKPVEAASPSRFTLASNSGKRVNNPSSGGYLRIDMESVSDNLQTLHERDFILRVRSTKGTEEESDISRWRTSPGIFLPSGDYQAWLGINRFIEQIDAGEARVIATLTLTCNL